MNPCARIIFIILAFLNVVSRPLWAVDDTIIAVVNDEIITLHDLRDYLEGIYTQLKLEGRSEEEVRKILTEKEKRGLELLIEDKLIKQKAADLGLIVREQAIDDRIKQIKKGYKSDEEFTFALTSNGYNLTDLREKVRAQLFASYVIDNEIKAKILVSPQEVTEFYDQNKGTLSTPEKITVDSICLTYTPADKKDAKKKAEEAAKLILEKEDFKKIAQTYSNAPAITDELQKGQLLPAVENKIFNLNVGETSLVIETDNAFYIFKVLDKTPGHIPPLEEVKSEIYDRIFQEKFRQSYQAFIEKLKKTAYVEIKK